MKNIILNIIFFADDQMTVASTEDEMQRTVYAVNNIATKCILKISVNRTKRCL